MNRNVESRFAYNPQVGIQRSKMRIPFTHETSFDCGQIIPFYVEEVLPADTFSVKSSKIVRMQTLLTPMFGNVYVDFYYFFVPNRLTWTHWKEFMGENSSSYWAPSISYTIPQMVFDASHQNVAKSYADYLGIPVRILSGTDKISVSALPFRALGIIYNEWFRSENLIAPDNVYLGDSNEYFDSSTTGYKGMPYIAAKYFDQFTGALPAPQKGPTVLAPIGSMAPVVTGDDHSNYLGVNNPVDPVTFSKNDGTPFGANSYIVNYHNTGYDGMHFTDTGPNNSSINASAYFTNLWADIAKAGVDINALRLSFQIQKLLEKDARGGTRYIELIKSHFNTTSPDYRLQRPEYLGGNRIPVNINQVIQQSETSATSPMGNTAAMSVTSDYNADFTKSFTEHGYVIGLMVARYDHIYQDGISRTFKRKNRLDYYFPVLANIGEQAVKNSEIYADGSATDDQVFGYQEAWYEYRYHPSAVSAELRSSYATSLDVWHLADDYSSCPALSQSWLEEDKTNLDRVLAVKSSVANQFFADIYVENIATRPMPLFSIPGLIDHH